MRWLQSSSHWSIHTGTRQVHLEQRSREGVEGCTLLLSLISTCFMSRCITVATSRIKGMWYTYVPAPLGCCYRPAARLVYQPLQLPLLFPGTCTSIPLGEPTCLSLVLPTPVLENQHGARMRCGKATTPTFTYGFCQSIVFLA
jgi:hypothetical protein